MKRNVNLADISDGRLYNGNDMVKADCHGCKGCSLCCRGMGNSVILDPFDVYRFQCGLGRDLSGMIAEGLVELHVVDGVVLPNLRMAGEDESCVFLNGEGRCGIHGSRPGICRLFPLGRFYEDGDFKYFLQTGECPASNRSKVKVSKWIDTPDGNRNHEFVRNWHYLLNGLEQRLSGMEDAEECKRLNMLMLQTFYIRPYRTDADFYVQFVNRMEEFTNCEV